MRLDSNYTLFIFDIYLTENIQHNCLATSSQTLQNQKTNIPYEKKQAPNKSRAAERREDRIAHARFYYPNCSGSENNNFAQFVSYKVLTVLVLVQELLIICGKKGKN